MGYIEYKEKAKKKPKPKKKRFVRWKRRWDFWAWREESGRFSGLVVENPWYRGVPGKWVRVKFVEVDK